MSSPFDPVSLGRGVVARNRLALAPLTNLQSHLDGTLSDDELRWLRRRAEGGFGIVETCAAHVTRDGQAWVGQLGVFDDALLPGLTRLASALRDAGAVSVAQLFHGGARSPSKVTGVQPMSASAFEDPGTRSFEAPRAATDEDLARVVDAFAAAAARAVRAGFDGVEIHGAHGYLPSQFLSTRMNTRDDAWGGGLAGRARLLRTLTQRVRAAVPDALVGVRVSLEDFGFARGLDLDESLEVVDQLVSDGVDFVHVSLWDTTADTAKRPGVHPLPLVRDVVRGRATVWTAGKVWSRDDVSYCLDYGADVVAAGRVAIGNADWAARLAEPTWVPARPPFTSEHLASQGLAPGFVEYMRRWEGFVA